MNWNIALLAGTALFTFMSVQGATAEPFKGAVVYGLGGKFDKSFNEGIATGVKRFKTEKKEEVIEFEISTEAQRSGETRFSTTKASPPKPPKSNPTESTKCPSRKSTP